MKPQNLLWLITLGMALISCEDPKSPADTPTGNDSIVPPDTTIVPRDTTIVANDTIIIGTGRDDIGYICGTGPAKHIVIVKFYNEGQEEKVIVQHPIKRYDGLYTGRFEYYEDKGLFLNVLSEQCPWDNGCPGLDPQLVAWEEKEMHIAGSSPYIPLANGYYMIDWKWYRLMPLSVLSTEWNINHDNYAEHIMEHCFMTDIDWKDLHDLTARYDNSKYTLHVRGIEIIRADFITIDKLYDDEKENDPYLCWNESLYCDGLSLENAYQYYKYGDCTNSGKTYHTYIAYCDSLQSVYQNRLKELINNGKLKEIGF